MARPPAAREAVLDAFERLIIADGERTATIDATARAAGVSKGGLLYHFGSKQALVAGLIERLLRLVDEDLTRIDEAPDGAIAYFLRSSLDIETPLDHTFVATLRLAQGGDREAGRALDEAETRWIETITRHVGDPTLALAVTLLGDGLYHRAALRAEAVGVDLPAAATGSVSAEQLTALVALLERLVTR
ncbi:TetR/AcrR family transcriptional regulator [Agromyces sp. H3Y2-19a]|uniref:TetR/AcrR family transcriptional regulator n=1 Tax=Agromyces TaxID=33877 RepID=UPI001E3D088A|nr:MULTISPECIES: TetR/AcrR family transcriptional regulator [Agromyces]MCD5346780.1 TetR/AcrR family transcriptional regulator [Agromyces sp. S2-1-8]MDF0513140.1 TetR/AcrR family transcriptional regulator [Agromyces chromiiresistens]